MSSVPDNEFQKLTIVTDPFSSSNPTSPQSDSEKEEVPSITSFSLNSVEPPSASPPSESNLGLENEEPSSESRNLLEVIKDVKNAFTEPQKLAYASLCYLVIQLGYSNFDALNFKSVHVALQSYRQWAQKITKKITLHLDINETEIEMIENLVKHKVNPEDIASSFLNPDQQERYQRYSDRKKFLSTIPMQSDTSSIRHFLPPSFNKSKESKKGKKKNGSSPTSEFTKPQLALGVSSPNDSSDDESISAPKYVPLSSDTQILPETMDDEIEGIDTWSPDLRHIILTDLFLLCVSEFNYDSRSRSLLKRMADHLMVPHEHVFVLELMMAQNLDFTDELETPSNKNTEKEFKSRNKLDRTRRMWSMAAAAVGGGLILGLSAGLAAPFIGAGLGTVFSGVGLTGTTAFLSGTGGAALITTGATLTGSGLAANKMAKRTRGLSNFYFHTISEKQSMNVVISIGGWLSKTDETDEDLSSPFTIVDSNMGDHYSLIWEPRALRELGSALKMLASEVITTAVQQALMVTMLHSLLAALSWPLALTRLGYLIDNPWQNALSRSKKAGQVLADILMQQVQQNRPVTLIGYSLGARVITYCLLELSKNKGYGLIEDVYLFGCPCTLNPDQWQQMRSVVSGNLINGYVLNDWILGYLFRASNVSFGKVAGLSPSNFQGITDLDLTNYVTGHMNYRIATPRLLQIVGCSIASGADLDFLEKRDEVRKQNQDIQEQVNLDRELQEKKAKARTDRKEVLQNYSKMNLMDDFEKESSTAFSSKNDNDTSDPTLQTVPPTSPDLDQNTVSTSPNDPFSNEDSKEMQNLSPLSDEASTLSNEVHISDDMEKIDIQRKTDDQNVSSPIILPQLSRSRTPRSLESPYFSSKPGTKLQGFHSSRYR